MRKEHPTPEQVVPPRPPLPGEASGTTDADSGADAQNRPTRRPGVILGIGVAAALLISGGIAAVVAITSQPTALERAGADCAGSAPLSTLLDDDGEPIFEKSDGTLDEYFDGVVTVEDDGHTLLVATLPQDDDPLGVSTTALTCVQQALDMPTWLTESMGQTRSLDGRQSEEWSNFSAQWSYHPDNGLNLIITQR